MEKKKMTKKEMFDLLLTIEEVKNNENLVMFIEHEIELLNKKKSSKKVNAANESIKDTIYETLEGGAMTISEMQLRNETLAELSNQKISALLRQLIQEEKVEKEMVKRKAYFKRCE